MFRSTRKLRAQQSEGPDQKQSQQLPQLCALSLSHASRLEVQPELAEELRLELEQLRVEGVRLLRGGQDEELNLRVEGLGSNIR